MSWMDKASKNITHYNEQGPLGQAPKDESPTIRPRLHGLTPEQLYARASDLCRLVELNHAISSTLDLSLLLERIIEAAIEMTDTEASSILLLDIPSNKLRFAAASGMAPEHRASLSVPLHGSIAGWVVQNRIPVTIPDAQTDPRFYRDVDKTTSFTTRNILAVPLALGLNRQQRVIGALEVINKRPNAAAFSEWDTLVLQTLAAQAAVAIENARLLSDVQRAYKELRALDRYKSEFIAIASHELRTPLTLILSYASFLQERNEGNTLPQEIEMVLKSASHLQRLIDDLTNLRYLETGQEPSRLRPCSLNHILSQYVPEFDALAASQSLDLALELPQETIAIHGDPSKLKVVVGNLLSNAIKFTPPGGQIRVRAWAASGYAYVSVQDNGIGIPKEEQEHIFDPFYQVEPSLIRSHDGLGLGLPIALGLVKQHGGWLWVESEPGRGSTFTFTIPLSDRRPTDDGD